MKIINIEVEAFFHLLTPDEHPKHKFYHKLTYYQFRHNSVHYCGSG